MAASALSQELCWQMTHLVVRHPVRCRRSKKRHGGRPEGWLGGYLCPELRGQRYYPGKRDRNDGVEHRSAFADSEWYFLRVYATLLVGERNSVLVVESQDGVWSLVQMSWGS